MDRIRSRNKQAISATGDVNTVLSVNLKTSRQK